MKPIYKTLLKNLTPEQHQMLNMDERDLHILETMESEVLSIILLDNDARVSIRLLFEESTDINISLRNEGKELENIVDKIVHKEISQQYIDNSFYKWKIRHLYPLLEDLNETIEEKTLIKKSRGKGRASYDATISLNAALHVVMLSKTEKGKMLRQYYIAAERLLRRYVELGWIYQKQLFNDRSVKSSSYHKGLGAQQIIEVNSVAKAVISARSECDLITLIDYEDCHRKAAKLIQAGMSVQDATKHLSILY